NQRYKKLQQSFGIIGKSEQIQQIVEIIDQVAQSDITVLIVGESGTGKELVAKAIHKHSRRKLAPMMTVNCGAIPEGIIESELFGHKKGAFTGATEDRKGYFELSSGGTIFLDEIGEMPIATQVKILRVLESGEYMRVGDSKVRHADVRIIAASNKDLSKAVNQGNFRKDLYFRIKAVTISIPPLRERRVDIPELIKFFSHQFCKRSSVVFDGFTDEAVDIMKNSSWPGNVRELKNFIESIIVLEKGKRIDSTILLKHLDRQRIETSPFLPVPLERPSEEAERELILRYLFLLRKEVAELKGMLFNRLLLSEKVGEYIPAESFEGEKVEEITYPAVESIERSEIMSLNQMERDLIERTLRKFNNNRRKTAEALKISERTLYRKLKEYGIN
ncbi:MAG: sigma-54 interaction domain-containing protein, partial [Fidelibacterota bacterium]